MGPFRRIVTVNHDTQYAYRWYGPDIALAYDWLSGVNGVGSALLDQTRTCLTAWTDYYSGYGYHHDEPGANYNAGYIIGKALAAIAIGSDGGADGHLWTEILDKDFPAIVGALSGTPVVGTPAGVMLGGDWGEGWQYGPLSVLEYATANAALASFGASFPLVDAWSGDLVLRDIYATPPGAARIFCGNGDCDITTPSLTPNVNELDAVLAGNSTNAAAGFALSMKQTQSLGAGSYVYNAIAEERAATATDYATQNPAPPLWYLARGTRQIYARSSWTDANAFWGVFMAEPQLNSDHQHFAASNFVLSRGSDDLIVDPSPYGGPASRQTNALSADASVDTGDYAMTQTPWSKAELLWARATADHTIAARADIAHAFDFASTPSDITYAHREWTMLPEGEVALIDRVHTSAASRNMYVTLHANTGGGGLTQNGGIYEGSVGASKVAIHPVLLSGGTPSVSVPAIFNGNCSVSCSYPCGKCTDTRFKVDAYTVTVPGTWAVAIHVIDALGASDMAPTVLAMDDVAVDPGKQNGGVIGASILRSGTQSYVIASSATDGASASTMTYGVPGDTQARHVVYDAPEAGDGTSTVTATAQSGRCVIAITAGGGGGFTGHPLIFSVAPASAGCTPADVSNAPPPELDGGVPNGDGGNPGADGGAIPDNGNRGCGCTTASTGNGATALTLFAGLIVVYMRRRSRSAADKG